MYRGLCLTCPKAAREPQRTTKQTWGKQQRGSQLVSAGGKRKTRGISISISIYCGNLLPTRRVRGVVVDGVYHRHPLAGGREHLINPNQHDGRHLAGQPGRRHKRPWGADSSRDVRSTRRRSRRTPKLRGSRRP